MVEGREPERDTDAAPGEKGVIAFAALEFFPATVGGTGILLHHTVASLLHRGYGVVLLVDMQRHEFEQIRDEIRLDFVNGSSLEVYLVADLVLELGDAFPDERAFADPEHARSARFAVALDLIASRRRIDLVEFYDYCGPAHFALPSAGRDAMPPVAVRLHNTVELIARRIRSPLDKTRLLQFGMERNALAGADLLLSPGAHYFEEEIAPLYPEASAARMQISPPVHAPVGEVAYDIFARDVVFYGRLSTFKGLDTFVRGALLALEDPAFARWLGRFLVIGPEETVATAIPAETIRAMIPPEHAARFDFTGRLSHERLFAKLGTAGFACFANRIESFCYAAHELATAGLPLILSDTPAFRDHFDAEADALFFDGTAGGLARRMKALAADPAGRARLSAAGRDRASRYDAEDVYAGHIAAARASVASRAGPPLRAGIVIFSDGDDAAEALTRASLPDREIVLLRRARPADDGWRAFDRQGRPIALDLAIAPEAALFLRAGDLLEPGWIETAEDALGARRDAGALGGLRRQASGLRAEGFGLLPEAAISRAPGLGLMLRLPEGTVWAEALGTMPEAAELRLLFEHRAAGRPLLDLPRASVDGRCAVTLPAPDHSALLLTEHDRLRPDCLAMLALGQPGATAPVEGEAATIGETLADRDLLVLQALPDTGDVFLLRVFDGAERIVLPHTALQLDGAWTFVEDDDGPVGGALRTKDGIARLRLPAGGRIELLATPDGGDLALSHAGRRTVFCLSDEEIGDAAIVLEDGALRFERPSGQPDREAAGWHLALPAAVAPIETLFLAAATEDFASWPCPEEVLPRQVIVGTQTLPAAQVRAFADWIDRLGARQIVLSSRIVPSPALERALAALPPPVGVVLALTGAAPQRDIAPGIGRLGAAGRALGLTRRVMGRLGALQNGGVPPQTHHARTKVSTLPCSKDCGAQAAAGSPPFCVVGEAEGMLAAFHATGAQTHPLPQSIGRPPLPPRPVSQHARCRVAILPGESVTAGIMHMVAAVMLARDRGLTVEELMLPKACRADFTIMRELDCGLHIAWYDGAGPPPPPAASGSIPSTQIALSCWPDEEWPGPLRAAVDAGWLPLAGATTALAAHPVAAALFTEPYWEDAARLSERLVALKGQPADATTVLTQTSHALEGARRRAFERLTARSAVRGPPARSELRSVG